MSPGQDWPAVFEGLVQVYPDKAKAAQVLVRKLLDYLQSMAARGAMGIPRDKESIIAYGNEVFARIHDRHPEVRPDVFTALFKDVKEP